ncbi:histidinol phosphate phosphatase domain-containing protein [Dehalococcoidia bacterium]|nr:histidinol phosphate phosphatase domain-containing protein [Dehalococcoidia bacterium]
MFPSPSRASLEHELASSNNLCYSSGVICDFHTHSSLSDGDLSPLELIHRAVKSGYRAIAVTDHVGIGQLERFIAEITKDCVLAEKYWDIVAIPGVELTHLPASAISDAAKYARETGVRIVAVHGETIVEPVEQGTNKAAVQSPYVDILAHPGLITIEEATLAKRNGVFIEISARKGHSLTNGHVASIARATGASLLLGSDAHTSEDLLSTGLAIAILQGAGLAEGEIDEALQTNPATLLAKSGKF